MQSVAFVTKIMCLSVQFFFFLPIRTLSQMVNKRISTERIQGKFCWALCEETLTLLLQYLLRQHSFKCLVCYFEENFDVRWSEIRCSCEKFTISSWIARGVGVGATASSVTVLIVYSVVMHVDVMCPTKSGSVRGTSVHCVLLVSVLCQLHRIVSFDVVKRENKSFAGWRRSTGT